MALVRIYYRQTDKGRVVFFFTIRGYETPTFAGKIDGLAAIESLLDGGVSINEEERREAVRQMAQWAL